MRATFTNALAGLNPCHDMGYLNSGLLFGLESLLLGDEIISAVSHFMDGIEINEETLATDLINKVGSEGNFLSEENTLKFFKKEGWYFHFLNRKHFQAWKAEGCKTYITKRMAAACPIPAPAPVIIATLPSSLPILCLLN